jgi:N-acetylglucosamine-6-sulfatase
MLGGQMTLKGQGSSRARAIRAGSIVLVLAGAITGALLAGGAPSHAASSKPNVIMLTTDDQTVQDMIAMPRTQELIGNQGANFPHAYVSMPLCCPSRVTVQTGQYAHNHGVMGNTPPNGGYSKFNDKNDLPVWLQAAGYRTIHIGKMPNGFGDVTNETYVPPGWGPFTGDANPASRGEFYGFIKPQSAYFGFSLDENGILKQYGANDYQTDVYANLAVDRIDNHFANFPNDPLYMQVQFFAPHDPADAAPRHLGAFATAPLPIDKSFNEKQVKDKPGWIRVIRRFGGGLISKIQSRYQRRLASLLAVDEAIDRIVNELSATGALANTYILFTSDNGFMQGQHRLHQGKFAPYEPSIRVPLLLRGPGIPPGGLPRAPVWNGDITSTITKIADANPGLQQDGRSLLPYARDPNLRSTRPILIETGPPGATNEPGTPVSAASAGKARSSKYVKNLDLDRTAQIARAIIAPKYRAIHTNRYVLVKYSNENREMYDLRTDPLELKSIYKDSRYFRVRKYLLKKLAFISHCQGGTCTQEFGKPPKPLTKPKHAGKKKR